MNTIVLIPAYKPESGLIDLVRHLAQSDFARIVVVDDGSGEPYQDIFSQIRLIANVDLLKHDRNHGKGAALKTGFKHILSLDNDSSVVTADADGQHSVKDILSVAAGTEQNPGVLIIGSRRFDKDVPPRSIFGNTVTRWVLRLFFGIRLWDTQSGLRCIPRSLLPALIEIPYDHYELELEMLMVAHRSRITMVEIPIETIYIENNRSSHFKPLLDSSRVYFVIFRYMLNSLVTAGVDYLVFILVHTLTQNIPISILLARIASIIVNYILLKKWVFLSQEKIRRTFPRFVLLVAFFGMITTLLIQILIRWFPITPLQAKLIVEISLYFIIFFAVKTLVFLNPATNR